MLPLAHQPQKGDVNNLSPLDTLFRYHIQENHLPSGCAVALGQCALVLIAAAGLLYAKPAADFAESENLGLNKNLQVYFNVMDTCYSAFIVLCAATVFFYRFHVKPQQIPTELADIIEPPFTAAEYFRKNVIIGSAAAFSAVPFVTIAYMAYQPSLPSAVFYPLVIYIFLANTLLHFLPIKLILDDPFYGAVPRYIKMSILRQFGTMSQPKAAPALSSKSNSLMTALNSHLAEVMSDLSSARSRLIRIKSYSLEEVISQGTFHVTVGPQLTPQEAMVARTVGAGLVIISCLGYLANPYLVFNQELGVSWWLAALATALPTFFLGVLFTYFGDTMGKQIWMDIKTNARYLSQCLARDPANPPVFLQSLIFKLYPTAAFAFMAINVFLAIFSAAAAMEMTRYAFADRVSATTMLALYVFAQIGVSIVAVYAPLNYQKMLLTYYALYLDKSVAHDIMMFHEKVEALQGDLFRLKQSKDVDDNHTTQIQSDADSQVTSVARCCWSWFSWFSGEGGDDKEPLLTDVENQM